MKSFFSLVIPMLLLSLQARSQDTRLILGSGITYCSYLGNPGLNLNATYRVFGDLHIGPDFSAILNDKVTEDGRMVLRKELEYNLNAHYLFDLTDRITLYPLGGLNYSKVTIHPDGAGKDERWVSALNTGGGMEYYIGKIRLFFEAKYVSGLRKYDLTSGILLELKSK